MAGNQDGLKKTLLGWVQDALHKVEHALDVPEGEAAPAPKAPTGGLQPPGSGQLPKPGSGQLPAVPPVTRRAPDTGSLNSRTDSLVRASGPLPAPRAAASGPLRTPEEEAAESKKRLGFITAYMKNPKGDPAFEDRALVYKVLSEERAYQQAQIVTVQQELKQLPPPAEAMGLTPEEAADDPRYENLEARRSAIEERLRTAQSRQTQLFMLMKKLTGVKGKTGGTGFLSTPPPAPAAFPPPPPTPGPTPQRDGVEERHV